MRLSNIDIKQLRIFLAVVECNGFTAAEGVLGISQPTISTHIADLESRLKFKICQRGRSGFELTPKGEELYKSALKLVDAVAEFEDVSTSLKGVISGRLRLGLIDNLISDPHCPILQALELFKNANYKPRITIDVLSPADIEYSVAAGRLDIGVSIAEKCLPTLKYTPLYTETDSLYCHFEHPLAQIKDVDFLKKEIEIAPKVIRSFLNHADFFLVSSHEESVKATVKNIEAAAFLILSGGHVGFLPRHYAQKWVRDGNMVELLPDEYTRTSEIVLIEPDKKMKRPHVVNEFVKNLLGKQVAH